MPSVMNLSTIDSSTFAGRLTAFIKGHCDDDSDYEDDDDVSRSRAARSKLARRIIKIKSYMLIIALFLAVVSFFGFIIITTVHSIKLANLNADLSKHHAAGDLFWLTITELKRPFQNSLTDQFLNRSGVGIRTKDGGQCIEVIYGRGKTSYLKPRDAMGARCNTRFARFSNNRTIHLLENGFAKNCFFCGPPAAGCCPHVLWCKSEEATISSAVSPSVRAVDVYNSIVYFSIYNIDLPTECAGIANDGILTMEPCTGKNSQLFYLDGGDNKQQFNIDKDQLIRSLRIHNLLYNDA